jgi:hypothetical protein
LRQAETLLEKFSTLQNRLQDAIARNRPNSWTETILQFAKLGISTHGSPQLKETAIALQQLVQRRDAHLKAQEAKQKTLESRLTTLLGHKIPLLGHFTVAGAGDGSVVDVTHSPATSPEVDDWLDAASRVHPDTGRLSTIGLLSELMGAGGLSVRAGQDPWEEGEGWAANHRPLAAGRLSIVAISDPDGPPAVGKAACGLLVDQWSEAIPNDTQVSGVTFQFDAPSNRPPQAWLLAVPPDGEPWSLELVAQTLLETLEWAKLRAVAPEDLGDYGRAIPTIFAPGNLVNWPQEHAND